MSRSKIRLTTNKQWGFQRISQEPLNGFATNSDGRLAWSLARTSLNVKVTGTKTAFFGPFGGMCAVCVVKRLQPLVRIVSVA